MTPRYVEGFRSMRQRYSGRRRSQRSVRAQLTELMVAALEDRALLSTILVTNTNDDFSLGSLRSAIAVANAAPGTVINFQIPAGGVQTINLTSPLPQLNVPVTIDATTQTGYAGTPLI